MPRTKIRIVSMHRSGGEEAEAAQSSSSSSSMVSGGSDEVVVVAVNNGKVTDLHRENGESQSGGYVTNKSDSNTGSGVDIDEKEFVSGNDAVIAAEGVIGTEAIVEVEERDEDSNLADVKPSVGTGIEIRDPDFIWSAATIVNIQYGTNSDSKSDNDESTAKITDVTVRYDGWGCQWDETLTWPSRRLAKLFTYTKRVKCFVDILSKGKGTQCSVWPCTVSIRMPHPNNANLARAEEFLRLEANVFVVPYCQHLLPQHIRKSLENGGRWMKNSRLRLWRDDVDGLGRLPKGLLDAHKTAKEDTATPGTLPLKVFEAGTLLSAQYRVRKIGGEPVNGAMFTGECPPPLPITPKKKSSATMKDAGKNSSSNGKSSDRMRDLSIIRNSTSEDDETEEEEEYQPPKYVPPPTCPPPIRVTEPVYPTGGVVRLGKTKSWGASVSFGGNDLFLGSFPTQTQAADAIQAALSSSKHANEVSDGETHVSSDSESTSQEAMKCDENSARLADLNAVSLESSMAAIENQDITQPNSSMSLHDWTLQLIRHKSYISEEREKRKAFEEKKRKRVGAEAVSLGKESEVESETCDTAAFTKCGEIVARKIEALRRSSKSSKADSKRRKQSQPQRLDLQNQLPREWIF
mmetsp:Transcript_28094/g.41794  ORF Transcript_28094/g.41794 Transcript_28094/m.41794 type:complete len:633 (-) Transcript_28094:552-2450(-)